MEAKKIPVPVAESQLRLKTAGFSGGRGNDRRYALNGFVEARDGEFGGGVRVEPV